MDINWDLELYDTCVAVGAAHGSEDLGHDLYLWAIHEKTKPSKSLLSVQGKRMLAKGDKETHLGRAWSLAEVRAALDGSWMGSVEDAFDKLSPQYQAVVVSRYKTGEKFRRGSAEEKRLQRAVAKLQFHLNHPSGILPHQDATNLHFWEESRTQTGHSRPADTL